MKKIISVEISNSNFFDSSIKFPFSAKLNCVMGGRGTGKSTLLHFIKACLDPDAEEDATTFNILRSNLGTGIINLEIQDEDGKKYKVQKSFEELPQPYKIPGESFVDIRSILNDISCDIYEAQSIEEIGRNSLDRLALIDKMITIDKTYIENEIEKLRMELNNNYRQIESENAKTSHLKNALKNYEGVEDELKTLMEDKPEDINKEEEKQFEQADKNEKTRSAEKRYVSTTSKKLYELVDTSKELMEMVANFRTLATSTSTFINWEEIAKIQDESSNVIVYYEKAIKDGIAVVEKTIKKIEFIASQLNEKHGTQQNEFTRLKQKFEKHKIFYGKWNALTKRIDEKKHTEKESEDIFKKLDKLKQQRKKLVDALNGKKKELFNLRKQKVDQLNKQFDGTIKITLTFNGITDEYEQSLRNALRGSNMRYNAIIPNIVQNFTPDRFAAIIHERDYNSLKNIAGIDKERSQALMNALCDTSNIYEIECIYCNDLPEFFLKVDGKGENLKRGKENYKKSEELSTGQRCTTVLPIVFAVSNNPLIIDQPEDNLDNKYISDTIHKIIRDQKDTRQLIFITHNPNIPVLSDADHNFFLHYEDKKSRIDVSGNIQAVKLNILNLLEGGKDAFEKRDKLYGKMIAHV